MTCWSGVPPRLRSSGPLKPIDTFPMPSDTMTAPTLERSVTTFHVYGGAAILLCVLWGAVFFVILRAESESVANVMRNNTNLALAVSEHSESALNQADRLARQLRDLLADPLEFDRRKESLRSAVIESESIVQAAIASADGSIIWTTVDGPPANIHDREHFRVHADRDTGRPFISKPVLGRVSGNWSVQVTRRVNQADGGFGGVVVLSLNPFYFTRRFAQFEIGRSGRVALIGHDGAIRARTTGLQVESAGDAELESEILDLIRSRRAGQFVSKSAIDGVERLDAFRTVGSYPLVAVVGVARDEALLDFQSSRRNYFVFGALVSALLLGMALLATSGLRRQLHLVKAADSARVRAERSNARKTEFVGAIAHEVRTPLSNIIGYSQLIASGRMPADRNAAFARQVEAAGKRVSSTMNDLLEIARIEAGSVVLTPTRVALRELLADTVESFGGAAAARGLTLRVDIEPEVPNAAQLDQLRAQQVLSHLVDNAIRHAGQGEVRVHLALEGGRLLLSVTDQGKGLPRDVLESLFNRFDGDMSPVALRISGTGLGLSIVKALVERMGGRVRAGSPADGGTRIEISLPLVTVH